MSGEKSEESAASGASLEPVVMCANASSRTIGEEKPATLEEWKEKAEFLWRLLDDIDTYGDVFKPDITAYFKKVNYIAARRHEVLQSDGHKIINT